MATLNIDTYEDSWVDSDHPSTNYGTEIILAGIWINSPYQEARALMKFDKDAIIFGIAGGTVTKVELYMWSYNRNLVTDLHKAQRTTTSWNESTVTWATRPSYDSGSETEFYFTSTSYIWHVVDVTSLYNAETSGILGIQINTYTDGGQYFIHSRENTSNHIPYLLVTYTPACTTYDNVYVNSSTGNDVNCGDVSGSPVQTFQKAYDRLNAGGTIHVLNSGADFSTETVTRNKSYNMTVDGDGYWYDAKAS